MVFFHTCRLWVGRLRIMRGEVILRDNYYWSVKGLVYDSTNVYGLLNVPLSGISPSERRPYLDPGLVVSGQEDALEAGPVYEGVRGLAVGLDLREAAHAVLVTLLPDVAHDPGGGGGGGNYRGDAK